MNMSYKLAGVIIDCSYLPKELFQEEKGIMPKKMSGPLGKDNLVKYSLPAENTHELSPTGEQAKDIPLTATASPLSFNQPPPIQPPQIMYILYCVVILMTISSAYAHADTALMLIICILVAASVAPQALKYIIPLIKDWFPLNLPKSK